MKCSSEVLPSGMRSVAPMLPEAGEETTITTSPRNTLSGCCAVYLLPFTGGPCTLHGLNHNLSLARTINCLRDSGWDNGSF